jgi:hypothetical protein
MNTDMELIKKRTHKNIVLQGVLADYSMLVDKLNTDTELIKSVTHENYCFAGSAGRLQHAGGKVEHGHVAHKIGNS